MRIARLAWVLAWAGSAGAQSVNALAAPANQVGSNPYQLAPANAAPIPATVSATQGLNFAPPAQAGSPFLSHGHGYVETGVDSRGGYQLGAGVAVPLVPGQLELMVSGATGQINLRGFNHQNLPLRVQSGTATLDWRANDQLSGSISVTGLKTSGGWK